MPSENGANPISFILGNVRSRDYKAACPIALRPAVMDCTTALADASLRGWEKESDTQEVWAS